MTLKLKFNTSIIIIPILCITFLISCSGDNSDSNKFTTVEKTKDVFSEVSLTPSVPKVTPVPTKNSQEPLVEYTGDIYQIFTHFLIAFPEIAYSKSIDGAYDHDCLTVSEFNNLLNELYNNNFVLVDATSIYETYTKDSISKITKKTLLLPEGKKPLVLSIDDMNYDPKRKGWGTIDKIILDSNEKLASYTLHKNGEEVISYDNEVVSILESFIEKHPDFSIDNAKATLALTGYVGVLGYRIDHDSPNQEEEIKAVKPVIKKLKENGWNFASHGYGHRYSKKISYDLFLDDTVKWDKEINSVIGPIEVYIYPFGQTLNTNSPKYKLLQKHGFKLFCGVGMFPEWKEYGTSINTVRAVVDGNSLRNASKALKQYFDANKVLDLKSRHYYNKAGSY